MWQITGRCLAIWVKVTAVLGFLVLLAGLLWGWGSGPFLLAVIVALVVDLAAIRGLAREWSWYARGSWWWFE